MTFNKNNELQLCSQSCASKINWGDPWWHAKALLFFERCRIQDKNYSNIISSPHGIDIAQGKKGESNGHFMINCARNSKVDALMKRPV